MTGTPVNSAFVAPTHGLRLGRSVKTRPRLATVSGTMTARALMNRIRVESAPEESLDRLRGRHAERARLLLAGAEAAPKNEPSPPARLCAKNDRASLREEAAAIEDRRTPAADPAVRRDHPGARDRNVDAELRRSRWRRRPARAR